MKKKRTNARRKALLDQVLNYIIEFEEDDFKFHDPEGPKKEHVFFMALELKYGKKYADEYFREVCEEIGDNK